MTPIKLAYLAGPYSANDDWTKQQHINRCWKAGFALNKRGIGHIGPHLNSQWMDAANDADFYYRLGERLLTACDGILMLDGWENSKGSRQELALANDLGLPVFYSLEEVYQAWEK